MAIAKLLGVGLLGVGLLGALPAQSEAAHRHDRYCGHRSGYSRSYSRPHYSYSYARPRTYVYDYRPAYGYYDDYYDDAPYYTSSPRRYVYARPAYPRYATRYHYHGRSRCYSSHGGLGIHLHIGR